MPNRPSGTSENFCQVLSSYHHELLQWCNVVLRYAQNHHISGVKRYFPLTGPHESSIVSVTNTRKTWDPSGN